MFKRLALGLALTIIALGIVFLALDIMDIEEDYRLLLPIPLLNTIFIFVIALPIVFIAAGGRFTEVLKKTLEDNGVATFSYPEKAVKALKALYDYSRYTLSKTKTK